MKFKKKKVEFTPCIVIIHTEDIRIKVNHLDKKVFLHTTSPILSCEITQPAEVLKYPNCNPTGLYSLHCLLLSRNLPAE
jgi:hypothetical protein